MNEISSIHIPNELEEIMTKYISEVIKVKPTNIYEFSFNYFRNLAQSSNFVKQSETSIIYNKVDDNITRCSDLCLPEARNRRMSIIPEYYNPADDVNFQTEKQIYPKTDENCKKLTESLLESFLFKARTSDEFAAVMDALKPMKVKAGDVIIKQGDEGNLFYVIEKGKFEAVSNGKSLKFYDEIGCFGELALLYNQPRSASVIARTDGRLWTIDRETFRRNVVYVAYNTKALYLSFLENCSLFAELTEAQRYDLVDALKFQNYVNNQIIIRQGDLADCMYFVIDGEVVIEVSQGTESRIVKVCRKGDYFGELALLTKQPRAASAIARGRTSVGFIDVDTFERIFGRCIDLMKKNSLNYSKVLREIFGTDKIDNITFR